MGYQMSPKLILFIGAILVIVGVAIPFSIILGLLPSTFLLAFFSYGASVAGLLLGIVGVAYYWQEQDREDYYS